MGKRKRDKEDKYDKIKRKLKKLEKQLQKRLQNDENNEDVTRWSEADSDIESLSPPPSPEPDPIPSTSFAPNYLEALSPVEPVNEGIVTEEQITVPPPLPGSSPQPGLDTEILDILGEDPSVTKEFGKNIQSDFAIRFEHVATKGLSKETRKELQDKYLPPANCKRIDAPILNPEAKAAISETVLKRDRGIEIKQKQVGCAITCIGEVLTQLMSEETKDTSTIKLLMDAGRLLCDTQYQDSNTRRSFICFNIKKDMRDQLQKKDIDTFLFGENLSDTIKVAKEISKSGTELKSTAPIYQKPPPIRNTRQPPNSTTQIQPPHRNNLNWKGPPPNRRPAGNPRTMREPVQRGPHVSSSRPSYRQTSTTRGRQRR